MNTDRLRPFPFATPHHREYSVLDTVYFRDGNLSFLIITTEGPTSVGPSVSNQEPD